MTIVSFRARGGWPDQLPGFLVHDATLPPCGPGACRDTIEAGASIGGRMTMMRVRAAVAIVALLLPVELSAQRLPLPGTGRRGPARPAPLPPQAEPIARNLAYKRLRLSAESYPLISYVRSSGHHGSDGGSVWTSFGLGTRADYRLTRHRSATLDLTSAFAGGPADVHTAELGTRLGSERSGRTLYRFVDLRVGYTSSYSTYFDPIGGEYS